MCVCVCGFPLVQTPAACTLSELLLPPLHPQPPPLPPAIVQISKPDPGKSRWEWSDVEKMWGILVCTHAPALRGGVGVGIVVGWREKLKDGGEGKEEGREGEEGEWERKPPSLLKSPSRRLTVVVRSRWNPLPSSPREPSAPLRCLQARRTRSGAERSPRRSSERWQGHRDRLGKTIRHRRLRRE